MLHEPLRGQEPLHELKKGNSLGNELGDAVRGLKYGVGDIPSSGGAGGEIGGYASTKASISPKTEVKQKQTVAVLKLDSGSGTRCNE